MDARTKLGIDCKAAMLCGKLPIEFYPAFKETANIYISYRFHNMKCCPLVLE